jgi:outer membrane lipoprotein-sorting protein
MNLAIRVSLFGLFLHAAAAQTQPDVAEILRNVSATYKNVSQYEFEVDTAGYAGDKNVAMHLHFAFAAPDKYRMEGLLPGMGGPNSDLGDEGVVVDDGSTLWIYFVKPNKYASLPASALTPDAPGDLGDLKAEAMDHFITWRYRSASDFAQKEAKYLREDVLEMAGRKIACYILTIAATKGGLTYTWWVDETTYRILREDDAGSSAVFTSIKLNEPIPDAMFKFDPPPGAEKIETQ